MAVGVGVKTAMNRALAVALLLTLTAIAAANPSAWAAPPEPFLKSAGPPPTDAKARAAIVKALPTTDRAQGKRLPFKVLSGPTLATGTTFGGSLEQAWLMCVLVNAANAEKTRPGPQALQGRAFYLRSQGQGAVVVPVDNWKDSSPQC